MFKWTLSATLFAVVVAAQSPDTEEKSVGSVTVEAASAYVFRGTTLNRGLVLQQAAEIEALWGLSLGATVGYTSPDEGQHGFGDCSISSGVGVLRYFTLKAAYIGQVDDAVLIDEQYDCKLVVSLSTSLSF